MIDDQEQSDDFKRFRQFLHILQAPDARFSVMPGPSRIAENRFEYVDHNESHLVIRNSQTRYEYSVPLVMIEFINPAPRTIQTAEPPYGVIRLRRQMTVHGNGGGSFV